MRVMSLKKFMKYNCIFHLLPKQGINYPIIILLFIVLWGFFYTTNLLQVSSRTQIYHSSKSEWLFLIAYSAMNNVLAKLNSDGWANRVFANSFYREINNNFLGGAYELFVEDTPNQDYSLDIYVKSIIGQISKVYFWRVRYFDDLLDVSNKFYFTFFKEIDQTQFPRQRGPTAFTQLVDNLLNERKANQKKSDYMAKEIRESSNLSQILQKLGGRPLVSFEPGLLSNLSNNDTDFDLNTSRVPSSEIFTFDRQTNNELPTSSGYGGRTNFSSSPGNSNNIAFPDVNSSIFVDYQNIYNISNEVLRNSKETLSQVLTGVSIVNSGNNGGDWLNPQAQQAFSNAVNAYNSAKNALSDLFSVTPKMMLESPSSEAAAELEKNLISTVVTACSDLTNALTQYFSHHNIGGATVNSINNISELENAINNWKLELQNYNILAEGITSQFNELANYNIPMEAQNAINSMQQQIQETREKIETTIRLAEEKLKELEAQAQQNQSNENNETIPQ